MKFSTLIPSFLMATSVAVAASLPAQALSFDFSGSDYGGTGSATMNFTGLGTQSVTVDLWNTSSTTLDNGTGDNASAITGFGFNYLGEPDPGITSWVLEAYNSSGVLETIGSSANDSLPWSLKFDNEAAGISLEYLAGAFNNSGNNLEIKGGIYNPDAMGSTALASLPNFFSKATLNLTFASNFNLDPASTVIRMQNVGFDGEGSLKLTGVEKPPVKEVPEPLTILGSAAALGFGARFKQQADKNKNKAVAKDTTLV